MRLEPVVCDLDVGNTEIVANMIGADVYRIVAADPYPHDYEQPMIMRTFIDGLDLSGKIIHPFVTYAVSGMGNTVDDYTRACPDSSIKEGLAVQGEQAQGAETAVRDWLQRTRMLSA